MSDAEAMPIPGGGWMQRVGRDIGLLALRLWFGGAMLLAHGIGKIGRLGQDPVQFADPLGLGPTVSLLLTIGAEAVCATLVLVGLLTRWATIPLIITMLVAAFVVHWSDPFSKKELALAYLSGYVAICFLGAGRFSLDALRRRSG